MFEIKINGKLERERERVRGAQKLENKNLFNFSQSQRIFFICLLVFIFGIGFSAKASAATYYWVGGTTNSNTSNPANWNTVAGACADSGNTNVPSASDSINFASNCVNDATFDQTLSLLSFSMSTDYTGTTTVDDVAISISGQLIVNGGVLYITNGGSVTTSATGISAVIVGSTSSGTMTIDGPGSQFTNAGTGRFRVGDSAGSIGNLNIRNGASASTGNISAAYSAGATSNITVDGAGTTWNSDIAGGLGFIGRGGNATLTISDGAVVNTAAGPWQIGGLAGSVGSVTVTGVDSQLNFSTNNTNLRVGYAGTGTLTVQNGGTVSVPGDTGKVTMADQAGSTGILTIGTGYNLDVVQASTITKGVGTATFPPTQPTSLIGATASESSVIWDWDDVSSATGYRVYRASDDSLLSIIDSVTSSWTQDSLSPNTSYSIYVRGTNENGEGSASSTASVSTSEHTIIRSDGVPSGKLSYGTSETIISLKTDVAATCKYDTSSNKNYIELANNFETTGEKVHSQIISNLSSGNSYAFFVRCQDNYGSVNDTDYTISLEIAAQEDEISINDAILKEDNDSRELKDDKKIFYDQKKTRIKGEDFSIANGTVKIYKEGKRIATADVDSDGEWSKKITFGHNKTYTLKLKFYDEYGTLKDTKEYDLKIDTENPVFTDPFPVSKSIGRRDKITFTASDDDSGIDLYKVKLLDKNGHITRSWRSQNKDFYNIPEAVENGVYIFLVRAYDKAGNYAEQQIKISVAKNQNSTQEAENQPDNPAQTELNNQSQQNSSNSNSGNFNQQTQDQPQVETQNQDKTQIETNLPASEFHWWNPFSWF